MSPRSPRGMRGNFSGFRFPIDFALAPRRRFSFRLHSFVGWRRTGQAFLSPAGERPIPGSSPRTGSFSSQRNVGQRCVPMTCRSCDEAARLRKHWPGSVAADPSSTCRQETGGWVKRNGIRRNAADNAAVLRAFDVHTVSGRRVGGEKARRVARMDSGQFAASTRMCWQRTPEPSRIVVRLHRTTDPSGCHFSWLLLFGQEKRSDSLDAVE